MVLKPSVHSFKPLIHDRASVAAVEFALVAPLMVSLFIGTIELNNALRVQAKLNAAAGQFAEYVAGQATVNEATAAASTDETGTLADMCIGAVRNIAPFNPIGFAVNVGSVTVYANSSTTAAPKLDWQVSMGTSQASIPCNSAATALSSAVMINDADVPYSLLTQNGSTGTSTTYVVGYTAIVVSVSYRYANILPYLLANAISFTAVTAVRPRSNTTVACYTTPAATFSC